MCKTGTQTECNNLNGHIEKGFGTECRSLNGQTEKGFGVAEVLRICRIWCWGEGSHREGVPLILSDVLPI
jgi:hypothetical protein